MKTENDHRQDIIETGRRIYWKGLIAGADGNISVRLEDGHILTTPSGVSKGFLKPEDLVVVTADGEKISGQLNPSSELKMHVLIYRKRPDVRAIVHAHPPTATGYAASGVALDRPIIAEAILTLGRIPVAPYGTPGTKEVTDGLENLVMDNDAILMANHGVVTYGNSIEQALYRMETVEHFAVISLVTQILGRQSELSPENVNKLLQIRAKMTGAGGGYSPAAGQESDAVDAIVQEVIKRLSK